MVENTIIAQPLSDKAFVAKFKKEKIKPIIKWNTRIVSIPLLIGGVFLVILICHGLAQGFGNNLLFLAKATIVSCAVGLIGGTIQWMLLPTKKQLEKIRLVVRENVGMQRILDAKGSNSYWQTKTRLEKELGELTEEQCKKDAFEEFVRSSVEH